MDNQYIQNLRYKLQKRFRRLNSAPCNAYHVALRYFWRFIQHHDVFLAIAECLLARRPDVGKKAERILQEKAQLFGDTEEEGAAIGYLIVKHFAERENGTAVPSLVANVGHRFLGLGGNTESDLRGFTDILVEPVYEYLDEQLAGHDVIARQEDTIRIASALLHRWVRRDLQARGGRDEAASPAGEAQPRQIE